MAETYTLSYTLKDFEELFENKYFIIPSYQRGYTWEDKQLSDFFNDVLEGSDDHYSGTITLSKFSLDDDKNNNEKYYIIDGQQRITTTIIFLQCICEQIEKLSNEATDKEIIAKIKNTYIFDDTKKEYRFKYENYDLENNKLDEGNPNDPFFRKEILNRDFSYSDTQESFYTLKLAKAKEFFTDKLSRYLDDSNNEEEVDKIKLLENLVNNLTKNFKINEYLLGSSFNVHVVFESMNNRGKSLSKLELLKNRFLFLIELEGFVNLNEKKHAINNINANYNTIYHYLGKNPNNPLDDDYFLYNHWLSYKSFSYNRTAGKNYATDLLNNTFTKKRVLSKELTFEKMKEYIEDLATHSKYYYLMYNPDDILHNKTTDTKIQDEELVLYLKRLNKSSFLFYRL